MSLSVLSIKNPGILHSNRPTVDLPDLDYNNVPDTSGNAKHMTLGGETPPVLATDAFGSGLNGITFNGHNNAVCEGDNVNLAAITDYSFEFRFKRDTSQNGVMQVLFARYSDQVTGGTFFSCYFDASNQLNFYQDVVGGANIATSSAITDSNAHVAAVCKSGIFLYLFIDGVQVSLVATGTPRANISTVPFRIGSFDYGSVYSPFYGTIGDFRFSNIARHTSNYTPSSSYLTTDANTLALWKMDALHGNALDVPVFQSHILLRSGHSAQASAGWAAPGVFGRTLDNKWFYTPNGCVVGTWKVWGFISDTLYGTYALQPNPLQVPISGQAILGNGGIVPFNGQYHHFCHDDDPSGAYNLWHCIGNDLNSEFTTKSILFAGNTGGMKAYVDPRPRLLPNGAGIEMFLVGQKTDGSRWFLYSFSADGVTWSDPVNLGSIVTPYNTWYGGAPASVKFSNCHNIVTDGAPTQFTSRDTCRWLLKKSGALLPLLKFFGATAGDAPYIGIYDTTSFFDADNNRMVFVCTHSENTNPGTPTDSDLGMWFSNLITY